MEKRAVWLFLVLRPPQQTAPAEGPETSSHPGLTLLTMLHLLKNETQIKMKKKESLQNYTSPAEITTPYCHGHVYS